MAGRELPAAFLAEHGAPWSADAIELKDEYSVAYLADGMRRQLEALFDSEVCRSKAPALVVHVAILPLGDLRCFSWRARSKPNEHVVALNIGVFEKFSELLSVESLWKNVFPRLNYIHRLDKADFQRLAKYLAIYNVAAHEFAHIIRGHLGLIDSLPHDKPGEKLECRKLCEVDADKWGSYILAGKIGMHSRSISQTLYRTMQKADEIALDLLSVLSVALYRCFSIYNQHGVEHSSLYPHPLLRAANISIGVADNFAKANSANDTRQRLISVLTGMELAEEFASRSGDLPQKGWVFGDEVIGFQERFGAKLDALTIALAPHSSAKHS